MELDADEFASVSWVNSLTNDELRAKLVEKGLPHGPLTGTTIAVYRRLLINTLLHEVAEGDNDYLPDEVDSVNGTGEFSVYEFDLEGVEDLDLDDDEVEPSTDRVEYPDDNAMDSRYDDDSDELLLSETNTTRNWSSISTRNMTDAGPSGAASRPFTPLYWNASTQTYETVGGPQIPPGQGVPVAPPPVPLQDAGPGTGPLIRNRNRNIIAIQWILFAFLVLVFGIIAAFFLTYPDDEDPFERIQKEAQAAIEKNMQAQ